ncbi:hypothetical protein JR316_0011250 [Psilocybe cubensis]|uniref:Uncharacterized protein n=2 Tax=Psilocybe cubensis TaxID=181762 RepID=A0ACB8GKF1_PSICU|nr:hypothetical protein JR316_0011250 [Psilocybe cubensis]KAH9475691.1 hypothetical protein JR316_0011250 [Psilocybe cubensis]
MSTPGTVGNTRKLNFMSNQLSKDVTLVFMFEPLTKGKLFSDIFPVCWKVMKFRAGSIDNGLAMYTADTGFLIPQVDSGNIVFSSSARRCQSGQVCELVTEDGDNFLKAPVKAENADNIVQCKVKTDFPATLGFGIFDKSGTRMEPIFTWTDIPKGDTLSLALTPKLKIYAVTDIKVNQVLKGEVQSPKLFEENLIELPPLSKWEVYIEENTNAVRIRSATSS